MNEIQITIKGEKCIVKHPVELIKAFVCFDKSYAEYDTKFPRTYEGAWKCAKGGMGARSGTSDSEVNESLDNLARESLSISDRYNREKISEILTKFKELRKEGKLTGIGITNFTKIVHRLSKGNFPLIDSTITKLYRDGKDTSGERKIKVLEQILDDFEKRKEQLEKLKQCLKEEQISLTALRIFDILLWVKAKISSSPDFEKIREIWFLREVK